MRRRIPVALVGGLVLFAALGGLVGRAGAAGVTTHTWMAMQAVPRVTDPDLQALLQGKAGEAPTNKTTRTGYQNLHQSPRPTSAIVPRTLAAPAQPAR